jgi:RHS repeat-associated protein
MTYGTTANGDGILINDGTTTYAQDLAAPLSQVLTDGTANYVYGHERLRALNGPWYIGDALGSVRQTLDDAGAVVATTSYDPWGTPQGALVGPFGFTGELHSAGQVYLRARWYAPGQGRFVSEDPFAGFAEMPYSLHAYQYAYSNPVRWTDPVGESPQKPSTLEGYYIQALIQMHFLATFPPPDGAVEFYVPKGSTRNPGVNQGYVDMARRQAGQIYEIKHKLDPTAVANAKDALTIYLTYLNLPGQNGSPTSRTSGTGHWDLGQPYELLETFGLWPIGLSVDYNPKTDGFWVVKAEHAEPGIVLYWAEKLGNAQDVSQYAYDPVTVQAFVNANYPGWRRPDFGNAQPLPQTATGTEAGSWIGGGIAAGGCGAFLWWLLKLASPICGPAAPACAVVL